MSEVVVCGAGVVCVPAEGPEVQFEPAADGSVVDELEGVFGPVPGGTPGLDSVTPSPVVVVPVGSRGLPATGVDLVGLLGVGVVLAVAGNALVVWVRRWRRV